MNQDRWTTTLQRRNKQRTLQRRNKQRTLQRRNQQRTLQRRNQQRTLQQGNHQRSIPIYSFIVLKIIIYDGLYRGNYCYCEHIKDGTCFNGATSAQNC
ncbi:hypothetical protein TNCV_1026681 [Trichonephila clavipes]|nr:hypothetical protein TNCV_1026681 [Trichonephila clavipes]